VGEMIYQWRATHFYIRSIGDLIFGAPKFWSPVRSPTMSLSIDGCVSGLVELFSKPREKDPSQQKKGARKN
jgi:hypothetical protein